MQVYFLCARRVLGGKSPLNISVISVFFPWFFLGFFFFFYALTAFSAVNPLFGFSLVFRNCSEDYGCN